MTRQEPPAVDRGRPRLPTASPRGGTVAEPGRLPFIAPMLATPARELPEDPAQWAAEVKWDGARALAYVADGEVTIRNRNGSDVAAAYPEIAAALAQAAGRRTLILDGEVTAF